MQSSYLGLWSGLGSWCLSLVVSAAAPWTTAASPDTPPRSNSVGTQETHHNLTMYNTGNPAHWANHTAG